MGLTGTVGNVLLFLNCKLLCRFRNYQSLSKMEECYKMEDHYRMQVICKIQKLYKAVWPWLKHEVQWNNPQITVISLPVVCVTQVSIYIPGHTVAQLILPPPDIVGCIKSIIMSLYLGKWDEDRGNDTLLIASVYLEHGHGRWRWRLTEPHHETFYLHTLFFKLSRQVIKKALEGMGLYLNSSP